MLKYKGRTGQILIILSAACGLCTIWLVGACDTDDSIYVEGSPCGDICENLEFCWRVHFYDYFDSVGDCANQCDDLKQDEEMNCIVDCGKYGDDCEAMNFCIFDC